MIYYNRLYDPRNLISLVLIFFPSFLLQLNLRDRLVELMPAKQKELKEVSTKYSDKSLGNVTVSQVSNIIKSKNNHSS